MWLIQHLPKSVISIGIFNYLLTQVEFSPSILLKNIIMIDIVFMALARELKLEDQLFSHCNITS